MLNLGTFGGRVHEKEQFFALTRSIYLTVDGLLYISKFSCSKDLLLKLKPRGEASLEVDGEELGFFLDLNVENELLNFAELLAGFNNGSIQA